MPQDTENILRELGERLRHRRLARRDRQSDMAARIGVSRPTYSKLENGDPGVAVG
ncbi:helix-turn-helix domain-containing protein, partial [Thiolapillus sp.]